MLFRLKLLVQNQGEARRLEDGSQGELEPSYAILPPEGLAIIKASLNE